LFGNIARIFESGRTSASWKYQDSSGSFTDLAFVVVLDVFRRLLILFDCPVGIERVLFLDPDGPELGAVLVQIDLLDPRIDLFAAFAQCGLFWVERARDRLVAWHLLRDGDWRARIRGPPELEEAGPALTSPTPGETDLAVHLELFPQIPEQGLLVLGLLDVLD
jgi:hypothetical protein